MLQWKSSSKNSIFPRYEDDPEYERRRQALSSCLDRLEVIRDPEARDLLWDAVLRFTDQSDLVSFAHGLRLGLRLALGDGKV